MERKFSFLEASYKQSHGEKFGSVFLFIAKRNHFFQAVKQLRVNNDNAGTYLGLCQSESLY